MQKTDKEKTEASHCHLHATARPRSFHDQIFFFRSRPTRYRSLPVQCRPHDVYRSPTLLAPVSSAPVLNNIVHTATTHHPPLANRATHANATTTLYPRALLLSVTVVRSYPWSFGAGVKRQAFTSFTSPRFPTRPGPLLGTVLHQLRYCNCSHRFARELPQIPSASKCVRGGARGNVKASIGEMLSGRSFRTHWPGGETIRTTDAKRESSWTGHVRSLRRLFVGTI